MPTTQDPAVIAAILTAALAPMVLASPGADNMAFVFSKGQASAEAIVKLHCEVLAELTKPTIPASAQQMP